MSGGLRVAVMADWQLFIDYSYNFTSGYLVFSFSVLNFFSSRVAFCVNCMSMNIAQ